MQTIHLIDEDGQQTSPATLALLGQAVGRTGDVRQKVLLLGGWSIRDDARRVGIDLRDGDVLATSVPRGRAWLGWRTVRRGVSALGGADVLHCWSVGTFALASVLFRRTPVLLTLTVEPSPREVRWLRLLCGERAASGSAPVGLLPISNTIRRTVLSGGVPESGVQVLRPGIDLARVETAFRTSLRLGYGIDKTRDKQAKVVALLSDAPEIADAYPTALALTIANEIAADLDVYLLIDPRQKNRPAVKNMLRSRGQRVRVIDEPNLRDPWRVLPGCDLAIAPADGGGGLSLLWAMAAGVPIVGEATYAISEIIEDRHSALLTSPGRHDQTARQILKVFGDNQLAWKLRDTASHEAYSFFSRQRYCSSLKGIYEQMASGEPIDVPPMESTGGLRFSGRA